MAGRHLHLMGLDVDMGLYLIDEAIRRDAANILSSSSSSSFLALSPLLLALSTMTYEV